MANNRLNQRRFSGPFGMGSQGYVITVLLDLSIALFASTRSDQTSRVIFALVLPVIAFWLLYLLSRLCEVGTQARNMTVEPTAEMNLLNLLARTNPAMFLNFGMLSGRQNDEEYQRLLGSRPYAMGRLGYLFILLLILVPLLLTVMISAVAGH